jgi:parallel beta-helix repeat protein
VKKVIRLWVAAGLMFLVAPLGVEAKTLYVNASTGNDATSYANNSQSSPWRTIGRAAWGNSTRTHNANEAARAGDIVIVQAGTYDQSASGSSRFDPLYNPANSGTSSAPITFRADGRVVLRSTTYGGPVIGAYSRNYIVWDGFYIDEVYVNSVADTGPVVVWASTGSQIHNTEIKSKQANYQDNHNGIRVEQANRTTLRNNIIYGVGSQSGYGQNDAAVMLYDSNDTVIENNTMYNCGVGVFVKGNHSGFTQDRTIIRYNLIYNMQTTGLMLLASRYGRVYQNVLRDNLWGMTVYSLGGGPTGDIWSNNTVHNSRYGGIYFRGSAAAWQQIGFYNNIISGPNEAAVNGETFSGPGDATFEHNVYFGFQNFANFGGGYRTFATWKSTWGKDNVNPISVTADPRFVNAAGGDFRLCTGIASPSALCTLASSVLSLGIDILDLNGSGSSNDGVRPGAYITGNETIGAGAAGSGGGGGTIDAPAAPTNVRVIR